MTSDSFEGARSYDEALHRGLALSGEDKSYFIEGRLAHLAERLDGARARRVLDFGCGVGSASVRLADTFGAAEVVGVDVNDSALEFARSATHDPRVRYAALSELPQLGAFDLCYVNGVYHHLHPSERVATSRLIFDAVEPGGHAAIFENNFWSVPARLVMGRISFDRDARLVRPSELRSLLAAGGFGDVGPARYLFVFPKALAPLRRLEGGLARFPVGAQCLVLARR